MQKKVSKTSVVMSQIMQPEDANVAGNVHGGTIMKIIAGEIRTYVCKRIFERLSLLYSGSTSKM